MGLSVIIPTYKRHEDLPRLFMSLSEQKLKPEEVIVVIGPDDVESMAVAQHWSKKLINLKVFRVTKASVVHALNTAFSKAKEEILCLLDDDVWLPPDWSITIANAFGGNPQLGAYGGRDHLQIQEEPRLSSPSIASKVGLFKWTGTHIGNHHCGVENSPVQVHVLKGCNLSLRRSAFHAMQIDPSLEWKGAETCWEIDICQSILANGYQVIYDNRNFILHYASPRLNFDNRSDIFSPAWARRTYNEALIVAKFRPTLEVLMFFLRSFLIGSRWSPGILWSLLLTPKHKFKALILPWRNLENITKGILKGIYLRKERSKQYKIIPSVL